MRKLTCHCGAIEIEINLKDGLTNLKRCNCSMCKRKGAILKNINKEDLKINAVSEVVLIIKTLKEFKEIEVYLNDNHPYDTPFIGELDIKKINTKYLEWISKNL